jgi:hypothetical protein
MGKCRIGGCTTRGHGDCRSCKEWDDGLDYLREEIAELEEQLADLKNELEEKEGGEL